MVRILGVTSLFQAFFKTYFETFLKDVLVDGGFARFDHELFLFLENLPRLVRVPQPQKGGEDVPGKGMGAEEWSVGGLPVCLPLPPFLRLIQS